MVPGNLPIGCIPAYLLAFQSDEKEDYEPGTGCVKWLNEFARYHNKLLIEELEKLRKLHPRVTIIYADYYGAAMEVFVSPQQYGEFKYISFTFLTKNIVQASKIIFDRLHRCFKNNSAHNIS